MLMVWPLGGFQHIIVKSGLIAAKETSPLNPEAVAAFLVTAVVTLISLGIMYWILKRFAYKPVLKIIDERQAKINKQIEDAEKREANAKEKLKTAQDKLDFSTSEAVRIVGEAKTRARAEAENIVKDAKLEAAGVVDRSRRENTRMHRRMISEVREEIADLSVSIATQVVGEAMSQGKQRTIVDRILDQRLSDIHADEADVSTDGAAEIAETSVSRTTDKVAEAAAEKMTQPSDLHALPPAESDLSETSHQATKNPAAHSPESAPATTATSPGEAQAPSAGGSSDQ